MRLLDFLLAAPLALAAVLSETTSSAATLTKRIIPDSHSLHERRSSDPSRRWTRLYRAPSSSVLPMRIGLKQSNLEKGHSMLMNISHPESPHFGKHLTAEEVKELFAPSEESVRAVWDWLVSSGISAESISQSRNKQWIQFDATVDDAEELLFADYHVYEHEASGVLNVACSQYHIPKTVQEHVDFVLPGIKLMASGHQPRRTKRVGTLERRFNVDSKLASKEPSAIQASKTGAAAPAADCRDDLVPDCIRNQYDIPRGTKAHPSNQMGIFQSLSEHYNQADLDQYFATYSPEIPAGTHPELRSVDGAYGPTLNRSESGGEAALDFELAMPLVWPQSTVLWQVEDEVYEKNQSDQKTIYKGFFNNLWNAMDGSYCNFTAFNETGNCNRPDCLDPSYPNPAEGGYKGELMCGVYEPTNVIAISYSGAEIDLPYSYLQRQCAEIMKLGLQGVTVVTSSGDNGVGSFKGDPTPSGCLGEKETVFNPEFISNCPYVLAVGATEFVKPKKGGKGPAAQATAKFDERSTTDFASGGGFSNVFPTPDWQQPHVDGYLNTTGPRLGFTSYVGGGLNYSNVGVAPGLFNRGGRGVPDVSAVGSNVRVIYAGRWHHLEGTSASAPIFGSMLNLINEERLAANKTAVGYVNQVFYSHPEVFNDITTGSNPNCKSKGFLAGPGWDPVSGLGTPKYPEILALFMSLP